MKWTLVRGDKHPWACPWREIGHCLFLHPSCQSLPLWVPAVMQKICTLVSVSIGKMYWGHITFRYYHWQIILLCSVKYFINLCLNVSYSLEYCFLACVAVCFKHSILQKAGTGWRRYTVRGGLLRSLPTPCPVCVLSFLFLVAFLLAFRTSISH